MKKVLVTGASGAIGLEVIKYLLSESKYEITALDLKNKKSIKRLKRYKKRINIVYGDVTDRVLIEALIKEHDIVIHLSGVLPPLANIKKDLAYEIDFKGSENIIRAISYYNNKCHLFYASTMSLYNKNEEVTVKSTIKLQDDEYYNLAKLEVEKLIKSKLKNYTIYRLPLVLSNIATDSFPLNGKLNEKINYITKEDAAYAFVKGIDHLDDINKKIYNVTDGQIIEYKELIRHILQNYGFSWKFFGDRFFIDDNFYNAIVKDDNELNDIIKYRNEKIEDFYNRLKNLRKRRRLSIILAKPIVKALKK